MAKKILIIDDDKITSKLYSAYFKKHGYEIDVAFDGIEGLKKAVEIEPDLILLDIMMPKLDGIGTLKKLREYEKTVNIPVVMLTVLETSEHIHRAVESGATHYWIKSEYSLDELKEKIEYILNTV